MYLYPKFNGEVEMLDNVLLLSQLPMRRRILAGGCRRSRGCTEVGAADGWFVVEATMRSFEVVVVGPGLQRSVSLI